MLFCASPAGRRARPSGTGCRRRVAGFSAGAWSSHANGQNEPFVQERSSHAIRRLPPRSLRADRSASRGRRRCRAIVGGRRAAAPHRPLGIVRPQRHRRRVEPRRLHRPPARAARAARLGGAERLAGRGQHDHHHAALRAGGRTGPRHPLPHAGRSGLRRHRAVARQRGHHALPARTAVAPLRRLARGGRRRRAAVRRRPAAADRPRARARHRAGGRPHLHPRRLHRGGVRPHPGDEPADQHVGRAERQPARGHRRRLRPLGAGLLPRTDPSERGRPHRDVPRLRADPLRCPRSRQADSDTLCRRGLRAGARPRAVAADVERRRHHALVRVDLPGTGRGRRHHRQHRRPDRRPRRGLGDCSIPPRRARLRGDDAHPHRPPLPGHHRHPERALGVHVRQRQRGHVAAARRRRPVAPRDADPPRGARPDARLRRRTAGRHDRRAAAARPLRARRSRPRLVDGGPPLRPTTRTGWCTGRA